MDTDHDGKRLVGGNKSLDTIKISEALLQGKIKIINRFIDRCPYPRLAIQLSKKLGRGDIDSSIKLIEEFEDDLIS